MSPASSSPAASAVGGQIASSARAMSWSGRTSRELTEQLRQQFGSRNGSRNSANPTLTTAATA
jgi:hypothetical protein